ncbi:MAG: hypothetical protein CMB82_02055 [Flammeovirgaceae bacterium]|nr:hypothetical protein [Flammeovirgaceae bacterium]
MMDLFNFTLTYQEMFILAVVGLLVGMAKTGIHGTGMIAVPLLAIVFGGRASSGIMLPILILGDLMAVYHYNTYTQWEHLKRVLPFAFVGVLLGTYIGIFIDDLVFRQVMAGIIFFSVGIMFWNDKQQSYMTSQNFLFKAGLGMAAGFTTMVGNLAGSVMAVYLLSLNLLKNQFIGTAAWFFLIINLVKVPFHVYSWETITWDSLFLDLLVLPFIALGSFLGIQLVKSVPEQIYRRFIIAMTIIAALLMMFQS